MRVAVIGGGISGLTAAYRLAGRHEVTLFEANSYLGGHTNTVDVELDGRNYAIDTGFIVFNHRTYPQFTRLLDALNVATQPTSMSFSVRCAVSGLEYSGDGLNGFFAQRRNLLRPQYYRFLWDLWNFARNPDRLLGDDESLTVGEYFQRMRYSREFQQHFFYPMGSAVWSCPTGRFSQFPVRFVVEFYRNHGLLEVSNRPQWHVIRGGSRNYVLAMRSRMDARIHLHTPVERVVRHEDRVDLYTRHSVGDFDHVIFACHSDQALRILGVDATETERELLSSFPYEKNTALLHTDTSVLPRCRRAWASWNYLVPPGPSPHATVTYNMNELQRLSAPEVFCVTLNGQQWVDPSRILGSFDYAHPVFDLRRIAAQRRHSELIGPRRTSFCGAYWGNGFHEDGVNSALAVCRELERPDPVLLRSAPTGAAG